MQNKEELKQNIKNIFTKIRNALNSREDEILLEVDKQSDNLYFNEDIIKKSEKLSNSIKLSLERGQMIEKEWNDNNKLKSIINDCINIENNMNEINIINENFKKMKRNNKKKIVFNPEENGINEFIDKVKLFGQINCNIIIKNEIDIIYTINEDDREREKIRIFGSNFVKNNKNNFKIIIDEKENELIEEYDIQNY